MATIGLIVFLFFGVFFELLLNISGFRSGVFGRILFPLMIIGAGVGLLFLALSPRRRKGSGAPGDRRPLCMKCREAVDHPGPRPPVQLIFRLSILRRSLRFRASRDDVNESEELSCPEGETLSTIAVLPVFSRRLP